MPLSKQVNDQLKTGVLLAGDLMKIAAELIRMMSVRVTKARLKRSEQGCTPTLNLLC